MTPSSELATERRARVALILGGLGVAGLSAGLILAALSVKGLPLSPLRAPFPAASLLSETTRWNGGGGLTATRQYSTIALHHEVIEWYWGKDSLMPLPAVLPMPCSHYRFDRRHVSLPFIRRGSTEEEVTICASPTGRVTVTSETMYSLPAIVP